MTTYICPECNGTGIRTINQPGGGSTTAPCSNCNGAGITPLQVIQASLDALEVKVEDIWNKLKATKKTVEDIWDKVK